MDSVNILYGLCVDSVKICFGFCIDSVWIPYRSSTDPTRILYGFRIDSVLFPYCFLFDPTWPSSDRPAFFRMESVWIPSLSCVCEDISSVLHRMAFSWIVYGFCMGSIWIVYGFRTDCV